MRTNAFVLDAVGSAGIRRTRTNGCFCALPAVLAIVLASGCISYRPIALEPSAKAAELQQRTLAAEDLRAFLATNLTRPLREWPLSSWDMETLTLAAFFYSADLDVARAHWGKAIAA